MIWILILSFGLLWVLADTQVFDAMMAGPRNMGEVNNRPVTYAEFNQRVNLFSERHREQAGTSPDTEVRAQYEQVAWEQLIVDKILQEKMEEMGITVTDAELIDMVVGDNPDPFIRQQFALEDGSIDRAALQNAIEAPENREIWIMIEQQLREQRRQQKLNHYIESSVRVNEFEIRDRFRRDNSSAGFRYVRFPYSDIPISEVDVSDSEIRDFYRQNQDMFRREKSWDFSYVEFSITPTLEDTLATIARMNELRDEFAETDDVQRFLESNFSVSSFSESYLKANEVRLEHLPVFELEIGEVSEAYAKTNRVHMVKLLDRRPSGQTFVRVRQIEMDNLEYDLEDAEELVDLYNRGWTFSMISGDYSGEDEETFSGELGYIDPDTKPDVLARAIHSTPSGNIVGPISHGSNFYIFEVVDRTNSEVQFAVLSWEVEADPFQTVQRVANEAEDFQYFAELDGFFEEAERNRYQIFDATATSGNPFIPRLGQSQVILNELAGMREGDISDLLETETKVLIFRVDRIYPEGVRPISEVEPQIRSILQEEKRKEMMMQRVREKLASNPSLEQLAEQQGREISEVEEIAMNTSVIPGAGREPAVVGAAFSLSEGRRSAPIPGNSGVFVMMVDQRNMADPSSMTSEERAEIREGILEEKSFAFGSVWVDRLKADATIRDFRIQQRMMAPRAPM